MIISYFSRLCAAASRMSAGRIPTLMTVAVIMFSAMMLPGAARAEKDSTATVSTVAEVIQVVDSADVKKSVSKKVKAVIALAEEKKGEIITDTILKTTILPPVRELTGDADDDGDDFDEAELNVTLNPKPVSRAVKEAVAEHIEEIAVGVGIFIGCIVFPFIVLIIIIAMVLRSRQKYHREQLRTIEKLTREGYTVPDAMINMQSSSISKRQAFSSAVKWLGFGVGLALFFGVVANFKTVVIFSVVPLVVGTVKMIIYMRFDRYKEPRQEVRPESFPPQFKGVNRDEQK